MIVSKIFRPLCITLSFAHNNAIVTGIIVTMIDNNAFDFNKCYFGIRSGFKKKTIFLFL